MKNFLKEHWGFLLYLAVGGIPIFEEDWKALVWWFMAGLAVVFYALLRGIGAIVDYQRWMSQQDEKVAQSKK